jgi:translation initiation factor IF-2
MLVLETEETLATGQILALFPFNNQKVAGTKITEGRLAKGDSVRVYRADQILSEGKIKSIRVGKEEVNKVEVGKECGIFLESQADFFPGDKIVAYKK